MLKAPNSLNVISFFHASTIQEAARKPIVIPTMQGVQKTPCAMDIVDRFEQAETLLGERIETTVSASGPSLRGEFKIVADQNSEEIDSPERQKVGYGAHTVDTMAEHIVGNWKDDAYNVIHIRAHGHAHEDVMGMPTEQFLAGLSKASEKIGKPLDTVLIESCLMGTLEVMNQMSGSVSTVIASQEVLNAKALPHTEMFATALDGEMNPRQVAGRMMQAAKEHGTPDTLIALEPGKLEAVSDAVGALKKDVDGLAATDKSFKRKAKTAVKKSPHFPRRRVQTGYRKQLDLRDLGELADSFSSQDFGQEIAAKSARVKSALNDAVIDVVRGPGYEGVSGVAVQSTSLMEKTGFNFFGLFG
jgi:cysteine peptidase C11 family protein